MLSRRRRHCRCKARPATDSWDLVVSTVALAGDRVAYTTLAGGNTTFWTVGAANLDPTPRSFLLDSGSNTCCQPNPEVAGSGNAARLRLSTRDHLSVSGLADPPSWRRLSAPASRSKSFQDRFHREVHLDDVEPAASSSTARTSAHTRRRRKHAPRPRRARSGSCAVRQRSRRPRRRPASPLPGRRR